MKNRTLGIIGCGKIGHAIAEGLCKKNIYKPEKIYVSAKSTKTIEKLSSEHFKATNNNEEIVTKCDAIILAVEPQDVLKVIASFPSIESRRLLISVCAGVPIRGLEAVNHLGNSSIVRVMPNICCTIGSGVSIFSGSSTTTDEDKRYVEYIFSSIGGCHEIPERLYDAGTAISGCGPAYVFTFIEALIDGGVREGLSRELSTKLAVETVYGTAKFLSVTKVNPVNAKHNMTSPGGITIAALCDLETKGFRASVLSAVRTATSRSIEMRR